MSVQSQITRIYNAKDDMVSAITDMGVTVPVGAKIGAFAALIRSITSALVQPLHSADGLVLLTTDGYGIAARVEV